MRRLKKKHVHFILDATTRISLASIFAILLCPVAFIYVVYVSQGLYLINVFPDKVECFKAINCLSSGFVPMSKYIFMWTAGSRLKKIIDMSRQGLNSITDESTRRIIMSTLVKGRYISYLVIFNQVIAHVFYLSLPILLNIFGNDRHLPLISGEVYGFTQIYESPSFEIAFVLMCFAAAFSVINQTGYIVLFITVLSHELGHFYVITETLTQIQKTVYNGTITDDEKEKFVDKKLKFCVKHQQFIMQYHGKIRELYVTIFGCHFFLMTVVLVTTLQTMNSWDLSITLLTGMTGVLPLFIYCFGGELLFSAEEEMCKAVYGCGWELLRARQARLICFVLVLSHRPLYLTAANLFVMNRDTFGEVVQIVYKIYAVFN